jgi:16S rRNA (guanine527-N7)-methyltransferase
MMANASLGVRPVRLPLGATGFARVGNVSRETLARLSNYVDLLEQWNRRINLVGRNTMGDVWRRHILDAAQLWPLLPPRTRVLVDLGSGAGIPGLVLAAMGVPEVHLVESDQRKAAFLREASRAMEISAIIHPERIEKLPSFDVDIVTARGLADLSELLDLSEKFLSKRTICLFLKGKSVAPELAGAKESWAMSVEEIQSRSDPNGVILKLTQVQRGTLP